MAAGQDDPYAASSHLVEGEHPEWSDPSQELLSYRYFGCRSKLIDRDHSLGSLTIRPDMRTSGGPLIAPLAIATLEAAGNTLDRYYQLWMTQIDMHLFEAGHGVERVSIENQVLRDARTQAFTEARLLQAGSQRVLGQGSANWAVLDRASANFVYSEPGPEEAGHPTMPPLYSVFEAKKLAHGGYSIPALSDRIGANVLHHGPILVVMEAASLDVAQSLAGTAQIRPKMLSCRIVRAGRVGPFAIESGLYCHTGDLVTCRTTVTDQGVSDALVAVMTWQARLL